MCQSVIVLHYYVVRMDDRCDWESLGRLAESQAGYVTSAQAADVGFHRNTLGHHARPGGRLERIRRGLYRLRFFARSQFDPIAAAWVQAGPQVAVVSHESALELYGLSDVVPAEVHLTLPRKQRGRRQPAGVRYHRPREPRHHGRPRLVHGVRATSPEETIVDVIEGGTQPEQIEAAVRDALARSLTTKGRLRAAASARPGTTRDTIERLIEGA